MTRNIFPSLAVAALISLGAHTAEAQQGLMFGVGGGATIPLGNFDDVAKTGWHGMAVVGYNSPSSPVGFRVDGLYGENDFDASGGKTKLAGGLASAIYAFSTGGKARPYLIGGAGLFNVKASVNVGGNTVEDSETKFAAGGGLGLAFPIGSDSRLFLEGRYVSVFTDTRSTSFIPLTVGVTFGIK